MAERKIVKSALMVFRPASHAPLILQSELYFLPQECADLASIKKAGMDLYWKRQFWKLRKVILWVAYEEKSDGEEPRIVWEDYPFFA